MLFAFGLMAVALANMMDVDPSLERIIPNVLVGDVVERHKHFHVPLDSNNFIKLEWWIEYDKEIVHFKIRFDPKVPKFSWFALGFSDYGKVTHADVYLLKTDPTVSLSDTHTEENGTLLMDTRQDFAYFSWNGDQRILMFDRLFDTCDRDGEDYEFEEGTTHIVWSKGINKKPVLMKPDEHNEDAGMIRVQLIKNDHHQVQMPNSTRIYDVKTNGYHVPSVDTTYYCTVHKMPDWLLKQEHHLIRYESVITPSSQGVVHHMEVFYCDAPANKTIDMYEGSCLDPERPESVKLCSRVRAAWAMGAGPFVYPKEAGVPLGGPDNNAYIMLEVHYNNPLSTAGVVDSSGVRLFLTPDLRKYEASIMELGLEYTDKMMIPPGQEEFTLTGECVSDCTSAGLPKGGIIVFGSQLHTHLTGKKVKTRLFRNGIELKPLNIDNHYSTHFQEIRLLKKPVHILPGDALKTSCVYDTKSLENRTNITFGGHSIKDEMCVNYIHYYPSSKLEVCKSSVSSKSLEKYFKKMAFVNHMKTRGQNNVRENYNAIHPWDDALLEELNDLLVHEPIDMECKQPSGELFPGNWEDLQRDLVLLPLPEQRSRCDQGNNNIELGVVGAGDMQDEPVGKFDCSIKALIKT